MKKLIQGRILKTEEQPLSSSERAMLTGKRNKQLQFLLISYAHLALILLYVYLTGPEALYKPSHDLKDEEVSNFGKAAPMTCLFFFFLLTGFFLRYYFQTAGPLTKDLKNNKKLLVFVNPEKTDMGVFNKYYLTTPVFKKQQLSISREAYYCISDNQPVVLNLAPNSLEILGITSNGKEIPFT